MSQGTGVEVMSIASEKFDAPSSSSSDEDEIVVKRKKKRTKLKSTPPVKKNPGSDSDEDTPSSSNKALIKSKKSRRMKIDDSSASDEDLPRQSGKEASDFDHTSLTNRNISINENEADSGETENISTRVSKIIDTDDESENIDNDESVKNSDERESVKDDVEQEDSGSSKSSSDSDGSSSDDDAPPLRLFRNKNSTTVTEGRTLSTEDNELYDDEGGDDVMTPDLSEIAEPRPPKRKASQRATMLELQSETQRLVRESSLNLPYHRPQPKKLSEFMKRPVLKSKSCEQDKKNQNKPDVEENIIDDLPDFGNQPSNLDNNSGTETMLSTNQQDQKVMECDDNGVEVGADGVTDTQESVLPPRPLTKRERLLQQIGSKLPQLEPKVLQKSPNKFIDLAEGEEKKTGVCTLLQRFMKHAKAGRTANNKKKEVELNIIRKEDREDGTGVELVADVVKTTVGENTEPKTDLSVLKNAHTPGQRLQLLRQQLAVKMKKRREQERKKREELHKLDNEEIDQSEPEEEEEDCDWSEGESDEDEDAEQEEQRKPKEKRGNGIIESSDESEIDEDTQPMEDVKVTKAPSLNGDVSLPRTEGSVMLFEDSTRSSVSTLNKSGRITPAFDRTCSDDSFYGSMIPLHQPELSNISNSSHFMKRQVSKGEFDDTCFETDSRSLSQPFRLDFEASQSQLLDADGYIKETSITKTSSKTTKSILPPGAEDDNAMTDCNVSQLLSLCSAPFDSLKSQKKGNMTGLFDRTDSGIDGSQDLLALCSGKFADPTQHEDTVTKGDSMTSFARDVTENDAAPSGSHFSEKAKLDTCDISNIDETSRDLFKTAEVDESFGFNMLSGNMAKSEQDSGLKSTTDNIESDDDDEPITIVRSKKFSRQRILKDFVENEAELSGSEAESDDDDDEAGPDEYEQDNIVEELPDEEEIQRQNNRVHRKQLLEEDQRDMELLQEAFMGGEEIAERERKFRWKNIDSSMTEGILNSDDDDDPHGNNENVEVIEDTQWMKQRLEREEFLQKNEIEGINSEDSQLLSLGRKVIMSRQNSVVAVNENSNQISANSRGSRLSVDETSSSRDSFRSKGKRGSFLSRSECVLAKLANIQGLKNINGPRHSDKMLFKAISPKSDKQVKRKQLVDVNNSNIREPPKKRKKLIVMNEDSNSVFDLM